MSRGKYYKHLSYTVTLIGSGRLLGYVLLHHFGYGEQLVIDDYGFFIIVITYYLFVFGGGYLWWYCAKHKILDVQGLD